MKFMSANKNYLREIESLMIIIILVFFMSRCAKEPKEADAVRQRLPSDSDMSYEQPFEPKMMTVHLPALPGDAKKLEMVLIEPGSFIMGSPKNELGRSEADWPLHEVTITRPFYIGKYEVTQAQWKAVMGNNPSYFRRKPNYPVEKVSWQTCQKFIKKLNALGQGTFRLPTEAEWEYVCRAGTQTRFSFGDSLENADQYMWWE